MSLLYRNISKKITQLNNEIDNFRIIVESNDHKQLSSGIAISSIGSISTIISNVNSLIDQYSSYIAGISDASSRNTEKLRFDKIESQFDKLKIQFTDLRKMRENTIKEYERSNLFNDVGKVSGISDNPYSVDHRRKGIRSQEANDITGYNNKDFSASDTMMDQQSRLDISNAKLDDILEMGRQAFDDIVEQNEVILKIKDKMSESLSTLGVSRTTVMKIEKVMWEDKAIFYVSAFVTLLIMYLIWKYLG